MDKQSLTERDICTKFILPAIKRAGWDEMVQVREEYKITDGQIMVQGKLHWRRAAKRADGQRKDENRVPDHLAFVEVSGVESRRQQAHPVPGRPQCVDRPDDGERFSPLRRGD